MKLEQLSSLRMKFLRTLTAVAAVAAALTIAAQARADVIDFFLTQGECTDGGGCGSNVDVPALIAASNADAVEVQVSTTTGTAGDFTGATVEFYGVGNFQNGTTANITAPVYINVDNGGSTANVTATGTAGVGFYNDTNGGQAEDSFGNMNLGSGAGTHATITFTLTAVNGFSWADAADVLFLNTGFSSRYKSVNGAPGFEAVVQDSNGAPQFAGYAPAPPIGHGLPGILAVAGVLFGAGLFERSRKRRSPGTAISPAAA